MKKRLLTLGHSYVVSLNRRLAREMTLAGGDEWEVTCAAPEYFHGGNDLAPVRLAPSPFDNFELVPLEAYLTRRVHVFSYGRALAKLLRRPWHFVHAWEEPYILAGWEISRLLNAETKLIYRSAQSNPKRYPPPFSWFERSSLARASGWICSGKSVEDNLRVRPGYDKPHLLSPLGVDVDVFKPDAAQRAFALSKLNWAEDGPPVVGYIGRFVAAKGLSLLMNALDAVKEPFRALFLGSGEMEQELRTWGAQFGDRVRVLHVTHDEVPAFVNAMDVLCAPSQTTPQWREQFGRMLVEAFACGVAVIGSDSGEIPTVLGEAGVVTSERDTEAWSRSISALLTDRPRRLELGRRGRQRAHELYAWPVIARQYLRFFDQL